MGVGPGVPVPSGVGVFVRVADAVGVMHPAVVSMCMVQPPLILPTSTPRSSLTYSDHVPFGFVPLNTPIATGPPGAGASAHEKSELVIR